MSLLHRLLDTQRPPVGDVVDRLSILLISRGRIPKEHDVPALAAYQRLFESEWRLSLDDKVAYLSALREINEVMWVLEAVIREPAGRDLKEIGEIAIRLRNYNISRNAIKANANAAAAATSLGTRVRSLPLWLVRRVPLARRLFQPALPPVPDHH